MVEITASGDLKAQSSMVHGPDEDVTEMIRNNPPDVVYAAFQDAFFKGAIRMFQRDNEMRNIVLTDARAREKATRHFFNRALSRSARRALTGG